MQETFWPSMCGAIPRFVVSTSGSSGILVLVFLCYLGSQPGSIYWIEDSKILAKSDSYKLTANLILELYGATYPASLLNTNKITRKSYLNQRVVLVSEAVKLSAVACKW
jgi:hypothetical protein